MDMSRVILVDGNDREIGTAEKMEAHLDGGHLHRAFSVIVFSPAGEIMLQKRAATKYHSQSQWTNTCCSHPAPGCTPPAGGGDGIRCAPAGDIFFRL